MSDESREARSLLGTASSFDATHKQENSYFSPTPESKFENVGIVEKTGPSAIFDLNHRNDAETLRLWLLARASHTKRAYMRVGSEFLDFIYDMNRTLVTARPEDVLNFVSFKSSSSKATQTQRGAILKSLFAFGLKSGRVSHNPTQILKLKRARGRRFDQVPSKEEVGAGLPQFL